MRIIRLQAEGFKRLVAVDISPDGDLVEVRGNNGNGKSSVLDAIFAALAGAAAAPEKPVREGEEAAVIRLDLGELLVTRYFTAAGTTGLKVTNREGFEAKGAQTMLDKLVGAISFDPLEFLSLKPAEQAEELRKLVTIADPETGEMLDLEALAKERARLYAERRDVNRDGGSVKARIEAAGGVREVPDDAPDRDELVARLASAAEKNAGIERERARRDGLETRLKGYDGDLADIRQRIANLQADLEEGEAARAELAAEIAGLPALELLEDVEDLSAKLADADRIADNRRANAQREALKAEFETLKSRSTALTTAIGELDKRRAEAIAAAAMPVDGLELKLLEDDELSVYFAGVPFSQASDAERLRVSCAVAMAANPELRVLRLKDASLLDKAAVETLRQMATSNDFQIWAEFVGDEGPGIIMESGEVRGAERPEPLPKPRQRKPKDEPAEEREGEVATAEVSHETPAEPPAGGAPKETLFERMARLSSEPKGDAPAEPERKRPRSMTSFSTKPRSE